MAEAEQVDPLTDILTVIGEISTDQNVPRNVRAKMQDIQNKLNSSTEQSVKIHDAMGTLDDISGDVNLDPFTRTQVYSIISMLEKLKQSS